MLPRNIYLILFVGFGSIICHVKAERIKNAAPVGDAMELIERFYVDDIDQRDLLNAAMAGLTSKLDPYTTYIPPGAYETFQDTIEQEFAGIGILIDQLEEGKPTRVVTPLVGSPALAAGFRPGDLIVAVAGQATESWKMSEVSRLLRGPIGSQVTVRVRRILDAVASPPATEEMDLTVARENIQLESVAGESRDSENNWIYRLAEHPEIAYVRLTGFGERTSTELAQVIQSLDQDYSGFVLDLRGNSGGLLRSAVEVCDMFLDSGRIVSTRSRGVLDPSIADKDRVAEEIWDAEEGTLIPNQIPIAVLVDGDSASASEIVAACLKDHQRALIVGERSFGKGSVQNVFALEGGRSALKLTTARYYRPNGKNIHRNADDPDTADWGVSPNEDCLVPLTDEQRAQVIRKWELATYPNLPGLPLVPLATDVPLGPVDPQLDKAVEVLMKNVTGA